MTIRFTNDWQGFYKGQTRSLPASQEAAALAAGAAVPAVDAVDPTLVSVKQDPTTGALVGAAGAVIYMPPRTVVANGVQTMVNGYNPFNSIAAGATSLQLGVPAAGAGSFEVYNGDDLSDTAVYVKHAQRSLRLSDSGSAATLPSVTLSATADTGWTVGVLARVHSVNALTGTTHYAFLKIGTGSAYFLLGYEGPNATNPGCLKCLMPNAAANGLASVRSNASPTPAFAAFAPNQIGQWIWIFVRKHGAALTENVLSLSTGAEISATFADETVTLAWAPVLAPDATGTQVYAGSTGIASGAYSAANAALKVGPDASTTGTCDVAKVFVVQQTLTQAQLRQVASGKRLQDIGVTVVDATDIYFDLNNTIAANLLDLCGGTAATSVVLAGADALTPAANAPSVLQYLGNTGGAGGWLQGKFADGVGSKLKAAA